MMDKDKAFKHPQSGNLIVVVGGRTGRDGVLARQLDLFVLVPQAQSLALAQRGVHAGALEDVLDFTATRAEQVEQVGVAPGVLA